MNDRQDITFLFADGRSSRAIFHSLKREFGRDRILVIEESRVSSRRIFLGRIRKLGYLEAIGQGLFVMLAVPILSWRGRVRLREIVAGNGLDLSPIGSKDLVVKSVNDPRVAERISKSPSKVVVINGTRIISRRTLKRIEAPVLNTHAGITPRYRGVHGGYWALAEGNPEWVGSTVHLVDRGIDTGQVVEQVTFAVTERDNFATYPSLHVARGIPALLRAVHQGLEGELLQRPPLAPGSKLRYHPSLWFYLETRRRLRVR